MEQQLSTRDIPRLIEQLRGQIQSETRRPISASVMRLSTVIEAAAMSAPKIDVAEDSEWFKFKLSPMEAKLATLLKANLGKAVRKDAIMSAMYGPDDDTLPKIVDVLVYKVNHKFNGNYRIENEQGFGYRMIWTKSWGNPRDVVEWRGIFMGRKAAALAERMFTAQGKFVHHRELARAAGSAASSVGSIMRHLKKNLLGTPYTIQNVRCAGYRMVRNAP